MLHDLNTDYQSCWQPQQTAADITQEWSFGLRAQQARSHTAALTITATRHTETQLCDTHMQQRKEVAAVSARPAEMSFCGDAEIKAKGRDSTAFSHTRIRKGMLSPASDKPDDALLPLKLTWSKKYWRSHLDRHSGCDVSCSELAQAPHQDETRVSDARMYI